MNINMFYRLLLSMILLLILNSTPTEYAAALAEASVNVSYLVKTDDFFGYAGRFLVTVLKMMNRRYN